MPPRRHLAPRQALSGDVLSAALAGIGLNLAVAPAPDPNLEDTLYFASEERLVRDDLRTLSMLTTWLGVHALRLDVARLARLVRAHPSARVRAYWAAVGAWPAPKGRLARLATAYAGPRLELLAVGTSFHLRRHGEDPRFVTPRRGRRAEACVGVLPCAGARRAADGGSGAPASSESGGDGGRLGGRVRRRVVRA